MLSTGRSGTATWARACETLRPHTTGLTVGHESRAHLIAGRLDYPDRHIEVDNRLAWFTGSLAREYGYDDATVWVHLTRDPTRVAESYAERMRVGAGIMPAFASGIIRRRPPRNMRDTLTAARLMITTIDDNIAHLLDTQPCVVRASIEHPHEPFDAMCDMLGIPAGRARDRAHTTLTEVHNARSRR